jgi:hypothetical protein
MIKDTPAFPHSVLYQNGYIAPLAEGMTLRDYFAAKAMQAILNDAEIFWEGAAPLAYQYADAMLKERSK